MQVRLRRWVISEIFTSIKKKNALRRRKPRKLSETLFRQVPCHPALSRGIFHSARVLASLLSPSQKLGVTLILLLRAATYLRLTSGMSRSGGNVAFATRN
jgi:hypothetical protein